LTELISGMLLAWLLIVGRRDTDCISSSVALLASFKNGVYVSGDCSLCIMSVAPCEPNRIYYVFCIESIQGLCDKWSRVFGDLISTSRAGKSSCMLSL